MAKLTTEELKLLFALRKQGETLEYIAKRLGKSSPLVKKIARGVIYKVELAELGIDVKKFQRRNRLTEEVREAILAKKAEGVKTRVIAEQFGFSSDYIRHIC